MNVSAANLEDHLGNNIDPSKKKAVATSEEQGSVSNLKKMDAGFDIPLSIFHYKGYDSDFFYFLV